MKRTGEGRRYAGSGASGGSSEAAASHTGSSWAFYIAPTDVTTTITSCKENSASFKMGMRRDGLRSCPTHRLRVCVSGVRFAAP
jgi:hypothetical protein